ncbi:MAG: hypothetical protein V9F03_16955 [Microthrixaceae bacterium]
MVLRRISRTRTSESGIGVLGEPTVPTNAVVGRRRGARSLIGASLSAIALVAAVFVAPAAGAQECTGTVSASVDAESLPGGNWSVADGCLNSESFYQFEDGPVLAKVGVAEATYADGHSGRVAAGVLTLGNGIGLAIVGMEDAATGEIKFSAVLGDFTNDGNTASVQGEGVALLPIERAVVSASISGQGTDVAPFIAADVTDPTVPAESVPEATVPAETDQGTTEPAGTGDAGAGAIEAPAIPVTPTTVVEGDGADATEPQAPSVPADPNTPASPAEPVG